VDVRDLALALELGFLFKVGVQHLELHGCLVQVFLRHWCRNNYKIRVNIKYIKGIGEVGNAVGGSGRLVGYGRVRKLMRVLIGLRNIM
jgi:hypothetical protein